MKLTREQMRQCRQYVHELRDEGDATFRHIQFLEDDGESVEYEFPVDKLIALFVHDPALYRAIRLLVREAVEEEKEPENPKVRFMF